MSVLAYIAPFFATIAVPKVLTIENYRLGIIYRLLQVGCIVWVIVNLYSTRAWNVHYVPVAQSPEVWNGDSDASMISDTSAAHCSDVASYSYTYSSSLQYAPTACEYLPEEDLIEKTGSDIYLTTMFQDSFVWTRTGTSACSSLETTECVSAAGTYGDRPGVSNACQCVAKSTKFAQNPEDTVLHINHGYQVTLADTGETLSGRDRSQQQKQKIDGSSEDTGVEMLTLIQTSEGNDCTVGGKSRWTKVDASTGIYGTYKEWLSCAGVTLDDLYPELASGSADSAGTPTLRLTGAELTFDMLYYNDAHMHGESFDGIVCKLRVSVQPRWTSWYRTVHSQVPTPIDSAGSYRYRKMFGIILKVQAAGAFSFFDYAAFITAIVNALVILGLPSKIMLFVANYGIGLISKIIRKAQSQHLNLLKLASGVVCRLVVGVDAFLAASGSTCTKRGLTQEKLVTRMKMACRHRIVEGILTEKDIQCLASVVLQDLDTTQSGKVEMEEFLASLTSEEPMSHEDLCCLFDGDRKMSIQERLLSDFRTNMATEEAEDGGGAKKPRKTPHHSRPDLCTLQSHVDITLRDSTLEGESVGASSNEPVVATHSMNLERERLNIEHEEELDRLDEEFEEKKQERLRQLEEEMAKELKNKEAQHQQKVAQVKSKKKARFHDTE